MSLLAVTATFTFRDAKGKTAITSVKLPVGLNISDYIEGAQKIAAVFVQNTLALLKSVEICIGLDITPPLAVIQSGADVQEKAQFVFDAANGLNHVLYVPTMDESIVLANSDVLDTANVNVSALVDLMTDGDGTVSPVNNRNQDVTALKYAREYFRRR